MTVTDEEDAAIEILQELGLKEYEANCFVGLSRVEDATAKDVSEITEVPRTRVYDAIRVLEAKGLVEVQHTNPQRFRAVPREEAIETLRDQFESRFDALSSAIGSLESVDRDRESITQEVWSLTGSEAIANRTEQLIDEATDELVVVLGEESLVTEELTEALEARLRNEVPRAKVFVSGLDWLHGDDASEETAIGRLLLLDRQAILISSYDPGSGKERALFGSGFGNGLIVIVRRLMETGLLPVEPSQST